MLSEDTRFDITGAIGVTVYWGDEKLGERHIVRLVAEGVYKEFVKDGIRMLSNRKIQVGVEEGTEGKKQVQKVSYYCILLKHKMHILYIMMEVTFNLLLIR